MRKPYLIVQQATRLTMTAEEFLDAESMALPHAKQPVNVAADEFARDKLAQLTLEEKVLLLCGQDMWRTNPVERIGVSRIKMSDGPVGVRGGVFTDGVSAASAPSG